MTKTITRDKLRERLDGGLPTTLVEALPARYYDQGHLPNAVNIPHDQVEELAPGALPDKDGFIVVYCASTECRNSEIATKALEQLGYRQVFEYVEGKKDWLAAGLPVEKTRLAKAS